jgi:hypothetical protein
MTRVASADDTDVGPAAQDALLSPLFAAATPDDLLVPASSTSAIPAQELAAGLDVKVDQSRRRFRSGAVSWMMQRSAAMGRMTDLLLSGSDTGWHLVVDPRGSDEYILEWKIRFR